MNTHLESRRIELLRILKELGVVMYIPEKWHDLPSLGN
jgi:hypothetical protein